MFTSSGSTGGGGDAKTMISPNITRQTLHSFEHKAISPNSATLNFYQVFLLDGLVHVSVRPTYLCT